LASQIISYTKHATLPFARQRTNGLRRKPEPKKVSNSDFGSGLIHTQIVAAGLLIGPTKGFPAKGRAKKSGSKDFQVEAAILDKEVGFSAVEHLPAVRHPLHGLSAGQIGSLAVHLAGRTAAPLLARRRACAAFLLSDTESE
jgi:hypothetical protein